MKLLNYKPIEILKKVIILYTRNSDVRDIIIKDYSDYKNYGFVQKNS